MRSGLPNIISSLTKPAAHKRRRIVGSLREMIASLSVGDRLPSVPELGKHFGVARSTIEAAVGELQAEGLIQRRQGSGTFVARTISEDPPTRRRVGKIGVACLGYPSLMDIFGNMAMALEAELRRMGYDPIPILELDAAQRMKRVAERWTAEEIDGYINIGSLVCDGIPDIPGVVIGEVPEGAPVHQVVVDNYDGGYHVGEYLWQLGHRRVAFAARASLTPGVLRFKGLQDALWERGAERQYPISLAIPWMGSGSADLTSLDTILGNLLSGPNSPTAIFFGNDEVASFGLQSLVSLGYRIPQDISVVSFDDVPGLASHTRPPLTCMRMPARTLAGLAAQTLEEAILNPGGNFRRIRIPAELIIRDSTGRAPDSTTHTFNR